MGLPLDLDVDPRDVPHDPRIPSPGDAPSQTYPRTTPTLRESRAQDPAYPMLTPRNVAVALAFGRSLGWDLGSAGRRPVPQSNAVIKRNTLEQTMDIVEINSIIDSQREQILELILALQSERTNINLKIADQRKRLAALPRPPIKRKRKPKSAAERTLPMFNITGSGTVATGEPVITGI